MLGVGGEGVSGLGMPWHLCCHHAGDAQHQWAVGLFYEATALLEMWDAWMDPAHLPAAHSHLPALPQREKQFISAAQP